MSTELKDQRVPVMMSVSEVRAVDAWRRDLEGIPSRSEAIRRLVALGLATQDVHAPADPDVTEAPKGRKKRESGA